MRKSPRATTLFVTAALACAAFCGPAFADGKVYVPLPNMSPVAEDIPSAEALLTELYTALVLASNCSNTGISDAEHSLLTDSFDLLAYGEMAMSTDRIVAEFEQPAFAYLDRTDFDACFDAPARKAAALAKLEALGGSLTPLPDQEKAYQEWRTTMDAIRP